MSCFGVPSHNKESDGSWSPSETDPVNIPCPNCGNEFVHNAHTLVNAQMSPELRDILVSGDLFKFTCPICRYTANLVSPFLYLDPANCSSIYLVVSNDMAADATVMFDEVSKENSSAGQGIKRIVFNRHNLREKVICLEAGLDDRVVEILKFAAAGAVKAQGGIDADATCVVSLISLEEGDLEFNIESGGESFGAVVPKEAYVLLENAIRHSSLSLEQPYMVDKQWAEYAFDILVAENLLDN